MHPILKIGTASAYLPTNLTTQQSGSSNQNIIGADIGRTVLQNGNWYRLVKVGASDIVNAGGKWLVTATNTTRGTGTIGTQGAEPTTAGLAVGYPTWVCTLSGARLLIGRTQKLAGVVPFPQTGSTGTSTLKAGDYFYIQVSGVARAWAHSLIKKYSLRSLNKIFGVNSLGSLTIDTLFAVVKSLNAPFVAQGAFPAYPLYSMAVAQTAAKFSLYQQSNVKYSRANSLNRMSLGSLTCPPGAFFISGIL
jgi:hypothetical protein